MEISIKEKGENSITLFFKDIDIGFLNLLASELLKDERVLNAYAKKPHPLLEGIEFYLLCKQGSDAYAIMKEKIEEIRKNFLDLKQKFERSLGKKYKKGS